MKKPKNSAKLADPALSPSALSLREVREDALALAERLITRDALGAIGVISQAGPEIFGALRALLASDLEEPRLAREMAALERLPGAGHCANMFFDVDPPHRSAALLMARSRGARHEEDKKLTAFLTELATAGWKPDAFFAAGLAKMALESGQLEALAWAAENGSLPQSAFDGIHRQGSQFARLFNRSKEANARLLERLVDAGALADEDGRVGPANFFMEGQIDLGWALIEKNFAPRQAGSGHPGCGMGRSAVACYVEGAVKLGGRLAPEEAIEGLRRLAALGAPLAAPAKEQAHLFDAFLVIPSWGRPTEALRQALAGALVELGADPNQSGRYLALELLHMGWARPFSAAPFESALQAGADPAQRPGLLFSALAGWMRQARGAESLEWAQRLISLGADPAAIPARCPREEHPMAKGFEDRHHALAWAMFEAGAPAHWTDSETGQTLAHILCGEHSSKGSAASLARWLALPSSGALIDAQEAGAPSPRLGQSALMAACGELKIDLARLLLDSGANPNLQDAKGWSALRHAGRKYGEKAQDKTGELVRLLLNHGADPGLTDLKGVTPGQAMAKRAPLGGLAELLAERPQDLIGETAAARQAKAALSERGPQATSVVERALLQADLGSEPAPAKKPRRGL